MNLSVLSVLVLFISSLHTSSCEIRDNRFSENAVIYQLFEMFRALILNGDAEKNVPKTDPFVINIQQHSIYGLLQAKLNITDGSLLGLGAFRLENYKFSKNDISLDIEVSIPMIKLEADYYEMDGAIFDAIPLVGSGIMYFVATDITINTKLYLKQSDDGKSILIDRLENTSFSVTNIESSTEFDKNIDDILNAIIEDFLASYLTRFSRFISDVYKGVIVGTLNPVLDAFETWAVLATIL